MHNRLILILLTAIMLMCQGTLAQTSQPGQVLEYNGKAKKTPLKRSVQINVQGAGSTTSDAVTGNFRLSFPKTKGGQIDFVSKPRAMGYELMNLREVEAWNINPNRSFNLVFCNKSQFDELCMKYYDISMKSYELKLNAAKAKLDAALKARNIQQKEYNEMSQRLEADYNAKIANIDTYVDQFARIDMSEVSGDEQKILALVDEGRIDDAIDEYNKLDATSKLVEANRNISKLTDAQDKIQKALDQQIVERDSLLAIFHREIDLLYLAGGEENIDKIGNMLLERVNSDTLNVEAYFEMCDYLESLNAYQPMMEYYSAADSASRITGDYLSHLRINIKFAHLLTTGLSAPGYDAGDYLQRAEADIKHLRDRNIEIPDKVLNDLYRAYFTYNLEITHDSEAQLKYATLALELSEKIYAADPEEFFGVVDNLNYMGYYHLYSGDSIGYLNDNLKSLEIVKRHLPLESNTQKARLAEIYSDISSCYDTNGDIDSAIVYLLKCRDIYDELSRKNPEAYCLHLGGTYNALLFYNLKKGNTDEAIRCEDKALQLYSRGLGEKSYCGTYEEAAIRVYLNRGMRHVFAENYDEALAAWKEVLKLNPDFLKECEEYNDYPRLYNVLKEKGLVE